MKIADLITEESRPEYFHRLMNTLKIKKLGKGAFATVFQHPVYHNVAVKYVENDPEYLRYLKLIKDSDNPWFPRVIGIEKVQVDHENGKQVAHLVFFEKLRKATRTEIKRSAQFVIKDIPDKYFKRPIDKSSMTIDYSDATMFEFVKRDRVNSFEFFEIKEWKLIERYSHDKHVKELARIMAKIDSHDLHSGNVMMRDGTDQMVITDPVASYENF